MRAAMQMEADEEHWKNAAIGASNLSELELTLGEVAGAVGDAEQSVTYADRSGDAFWKLASRTTHADALHQAGRRAEAETRFREAEQMQAERQPAYPRLYSVQGFQYCDLLLAVPERAAWQALLSHPLPTSPLARGRNIATSPLVRGRQGGGLPAGEENLESCRAVSQRAAPTLKWEEGMRGAPLLDIALDHLTLGRAALYAAILDNAEWETARRELDAAVAGLRHANRSDYLPRGLLTRAWLRFLDPATDSAGPSTGSGRTALEGAQEDLDEAWEIAERGPMRLFMADVHLHRARLCFREEKYPWTSPQADLAAARQLIDHCGYGRRREELADAEAALVGW